MLGWLDLFRSFKRFILFFICKRNSGGKVIFSCNQSLTFSATSRKSNCKFLSCYSKVLVLGGQLMLQKVFEGAEFIGSYSQSNTLLVYWMLCNRYLFLSQCWCSSCGREIVIQQYLSKGTLLCLVQE